ncbi:MAG: PadR family transcriptional regulator [Bryobacteraceae bacterium]
MRTTAKARNNEDRQPPLLREILLSFWKIHILHHAGEEPVYGQWMIAELRRHGYEISPGTLYPILRRMEQQGWLAPAPKKKGDPARRKQYRLTPQGKAALRTICRQLEELYREVSPAPRPAAPAARKRFY